MKVSGEHTVAVARQELWDALHDPELLRNALPGCSKLDCAEPGRYTVTIRVGIPCVEGAYHGDLQLVERTAPSSLALEASAAGEQGNGRGQVQLDLDETDGGTRVRFDIHAEVGGAIARVGHRLLASAVQRTVADHLDAVAEACGGGSVPAMPSGAGTAAAGAGRSGIPAADTGPTTEPDPRFAPLALTQRQAVAAAVAASALIGVLVGRWSRR